MCPHYRKSEKRKRVESNNRQRERETHSIQAFVALPTEVELSCSDPGDIGSLGATAASGQW